jgi:hypothetical protein
MRRKKNRQALPSPADFRTRIEAIRRKLDDDDEGFADIFKILRKLIAEEESKGRRIGYQTEGLQRGKLRYTTLGPR